MRRERYSPSRSSSDSRRHNRRRSPSRSRDKKNRTNRKHSRDYDPIPIKHESDIKNHFVFKIKPLSEKEELERVSMLKQKLNECVGPVEHITRIRGDKYTTLNLGFKYDIDAISYLQGDLTIKTSSEHIKLSPKPTEVFEQILLKKYSKEILE